MKQKLALMCTLLHKPRVLFLDEPTNGVDPVSRRDFWAILYQLVSEGLTVLVSTAYLDEAERANRVGMMHQGRMIRCDTPAALKESLEETCYRVHFRASGRSAAAAGTPARRARRLPRRHRISLVRRRAHHQGREPAEITPFTYQRIVPSLEDVFIALERKEEVAHAA